jgi:hypothetical protein
MILLMAQHILTREISKLRQSPASEILIAMVDRVGHGYIALLRPHLWSKLYLKFSAITVLLTCGSFFSQAKETIGDQQLNMKQEIKFTWKTETNSMAISTGSSASQEVRSTICPALVSGNPRSLNIVAFKMPQTDMIWVGHRMDFYFAVTSNLVGGKLVPGGAIQWSESFVNPALTSNLDEAVEYFEKHVDITTVLKPLVERTDLRRHLQREFFNAGPLSDSDIK